MIWEKNSFSSEKTTHLQAEIHECTPSGSKTDRFEYCTLCQIIMLKAKNQTNPNIKFFRSKEYSCQDFPHINPNKILENLIKTQASNRFFNISLSNFQPRLALINWIRRLCQNFKYSLTTFYLSIGILDAVLSLYQLEEIQYKLLGFISLYIAAKKHEQENKIPKIKEVILFFKGEFLESDFCEYELFIVNIFNWNFNLKTPFQFVSFFLSRGIVSSADFIENVSSETIEETVFKVEKLALYFLEISLDDYRFYMYTSIAIAASSIAAARIFLKLSFWNEYLETLTNVSWSSIEDCVGHLLKNSKDSPFLTLVDIENKLERINNDQFQTQTPPKKKGIEQKTSDDKRSEKGKKFDNKHLRNTKLSSFDDRESEYNDSQMDMCSLGMSIEQSDKKLNVLSNEKLCYEMSNMVLEDENKENQSNRKVKQIRKDYFGFPK